LGHRLVFKFDGLTRFPFWPISDFSAISSAHVRPSGSFGRGSSGLLLSAFKSVLLFGLPEGLPLVLSSSGEISALWRYSDCCSRPSLGLPVGAKYADRVKKQDCSRVIMKQP
jgi:hypothetical protein